MLRDNFAFLVSSVSSSYVLICQSILYTIYHSGSLHHIIVGLFALQCKYPDNYMMERPHIPWYACCIEREGTPPWGRNNSEKIESKSLMGSLNATATPPSENIEHYGTNLISTFLQFVLSPIKWRHFHYRFHWKNIFSIMTQHSRIIFLTHKFSKPKVMVAQ